MVKILLSYRYDVTNFGKILNSIVFSRAERVSEILAEREGFEPSERYKRSLPFQDSAIDHSAISPKNDYKGN
jgi:hypothetical protein